VTPELSPWVLLNERARQAQAVRPRSKRITPFDGVVADLLQVYVTKEGRVIACKTNPTKPRLFDRTCASGSLVSVPGGKARR
jgi:hypothetical protein